MIMWKVLLNYIQAHYLRLRVEPSYTALGQCASIWCMLAGIEPAVPVGVVDPPHTWIRTMLPKPLSAYKIGRMPRTRTEKHFVLSEIGIPIPFNIPLNLKIPVRGKLLIYLRIIYALSLFVKDFFF